MPRITKSKVGRTIYNHIINNKREYLIITILFFVGITFGVLFINNANGTQIQEIDSYLNSLISEIKEYGNVNLFALFKKSILYNILIALILWFGATTIAGIPIVHGTILIKGFSIGYTISSIICCFGIGNGLLIVLSLLTLHNIVLLPAIFAICVSRNEII